MASILSFTPAVPSQTCPRCDGKGYEAVFNQFVGEVTAAPCGLCDGTGQFSALMQAERESRYWRSRWESVRLNKRAWKERQTAAENLEFWSNKVAMYSVMRKPEAR